MRIYFQVVRTRGRLRDPAVPAYAVAKDDETPAEAVAWALARKNGLALCTRVSEPAAGQYHVALGRHVPGGYSPEVEFDFRLSP